MILWRISDKILMISMQNISGNNLFCANLWNIDVSLLLRRWSLMILWRDILETVIISMKLFLIFFVRNVLTSEALIFDCWFIDNSLMIPWRNIEVTAKVPMQASMIFKCFIDLISETLMFHCCFVVDCWWFFGETFFNYW